MSTTLTTTPPTTTPPTTAAPTTAAPTTGALWPRAPIVMHPATVHDTDDLLMMFSLMSAESRRLRFFQAMPRVPRSTVRYLCDVDHEQHRAWLARAGGRGGPVIGEVRAVRHRGCPEAAELAVAVRDDWSGLGVGRGLLEWIFDDLASIGVTTVTCEVLADNRRSLELFRSMGLEFRFDGGVLTGRGVSRRPRATVGSEPS